METTPLKTYLYEGHSKDNSAFCLCLCQLERKILLLSEGKGAPSCTNELPQEFSTHNVVIYSENIQSKFFSNKEVGI